MEKNTLFVHGLTGSHRDEKHSQREAFRKELACLGFHSYVFEYRGRGNDHKNDLKFTLNTAIEDLNCTLEWLSKKEKCENCIIIGRGLAAYIILKSSEAKTLNWPCILWQPVFFPKLTLDNLGHIKAFYEYYNKSDGQKYNELMNVRLGKAFFDSLQDITIDSIWDGIDMHILYTIGDTVSLAKWIEDFVMQIQSDTSLTCKITLDMIDNEQKPIDHLRYGSSLEPFTKRTIDILSNYSKYPLRKGLDKHE